MESERSIVLQKKMILLLSLLIGIITGILCVRDVKNINEPNYYSSLDSEAINNVTEENEIFSENVKYLATKIVENNNFNLLENESVESYAGDVTSLINDESVAYSESNDSKLINAELVEVSNQAIVSDADVKEDVVDEENTNDIPKYVRYRDLAENNPPTEYEKVIEATATAYCLCTKCCGKTPDNPNYGHTRSGLVIKPGTGVKVIAVDPNVIPLNTKVYVEGLNGAWDYGTAIAADTGSAIKELKIDIYVDTHEEALEWGRRKVNVYVLGE